MHVIAWLANSRTDAVPVTVCDALGGRAGTPGLIHSVISLFHQAPTTSLPHLPHTLHSLSPQSLIYQRRPSPLFSLLLNCSRHVRRARPCRAGVQAWVANVSRIRSSSDSSVLPGPFTHEVAQVLRLYNKNTDPVAFKVPPLPYACLTRADPLNPGQDHRPQTVSSTSIPPLIRF